MVGQNRTDLVGQPALEANAAEHGSKAAGERAQAAVPMADAPGVPVPMNAPTMRPNEPITAGLPTGPGPGPGLVPHRDDQVMAQIRGLVQALKDPRLAMLAGRLQQSRSRRQ